jgi:tRNA pseudouridine55 synthase
MKDILLIDKPKGITSFDCIRILRRTLGVKKLGHAGTLDPMATGLMIIGVGNGTKKLQDFLKLDKTYEAEILLGVSTDTGDVTGKILKELGSMNYELWKGKEAEIKKVLDGMVGKLQLPVPAYSAVKRGGEPLYKKARRGEKVESPIKIMEVADCELLAVCHPSEGGDPENDRVIVKVRFDVGSGTYIRSLAEEFGKRLGVPATLANLRRTRIGEFRVEDTEKINPLP